MPVPKECERLQPKLTQVQAPGTKLVPWGRGMTYFNFNAENEIGVSSIDQQHHGLVDLINQIDDLIFAHAPVAELQCLFDQLYAGTEQHFLHEEELFERSPYERAARHKREHASLLLILKRFCQALNHQDLSANPSDYLWFLQTWLIDHIKREDRQLGAHLNSLGNQ